jgi:hypothetical protein
MLREHFCGECGRAEVKGVDRVFKDDEQKPIEQLREEFRKFMDHLVEVKLPARSTAH